jgi:hypothetical protein
MRPEVIARGLPRRPPGVGRTGAGGLLAAVLLGFACNGAAGAPPAPTLTFEGYGAVLFGMTVTQARDAVRESSAEDQLAPDTQECHYVTLAAYPHTRLMVEEGRITRVEVGRSARNVLALKVGMSLAEVRRRHPEVRVMPHKYDEHGHYLIFASPSGKSEIVAEASNGLITLIRGGLLPAVEYVEGCS